MFSTPLPAASKAFSLGYKSELVSCLFPANIFQLRLKSTNTAAFLEVLNLANCANDGYYRMGISSRE